MLTTYLQQQQQLLSNITTEPHLALFWGAALVKLLTTLKQGGTIFIAGNGGSAADAQHFAAELVGRFLKERRGYPAVALTTDSSALTAIANDYGFEKIFSRQLEALARSADCFVGITTSGNSENILEAVRYARQRGIATIILTGRDGGLVKDLCDIALVVPSDVTSHIQEVHLMLYHAWCLQLEKLLHE